MSDHAEVPGETQGEADEERRERGGVYGGWREARTLGDVEEHERLVDRYAERNPGMVDRSDAAIAREPIGRGEVGMPVRRITGRGAEVMREDAS